MPKPTPEPVLPHHVKDLALKVIAEDRFPMLGTVAGDQPRVRPISPLKSVGFTIYFASLRSYGKTGELIANPNVELAYMNSSHDQVRLTGTATEVTDRDTRQMLWDENALLRQFMGSLDNPELLIYQVQPERVRFMREWALQYHEVDV